MANPSPSTPGTSARPSEQEEQDPSLLSLIASNGFPDSEDYVQLMLEKEKIHHSSSSSASSSVFNGDLIKIARLTAVDGILNTREQLRFQFQTAYLAVAYLDRFLALRNFEGEKTWAMQLLSVGCLSLAVKMQESNSWRLSSYEFGGFRFDDSVIGRMELMILSTLEWKMNSVTPFAYLPYFINVIIDKPPPWSTLRRILELIIAFVRDVFLMDHYPSAVALAAVMVSLDRRLTRTTLELKINTIPCSQHLDLVDVYDCCQIMQKPERLVSSPDLSPMNPRRMNTFQDSPDTSSISSKRRRLGFDDADDQNQD